MPELFLPEVDPAKLKAALTSGDDDALYELLVTPLHEELYKRQDFDFLDDLTHGQQILLSFDYIQAQVGQGGFIQLLQNGYVALLPNLPEMLDEIDAEPMAQLIDDVLRVYVLNYEMLDKETTPEEFAKLYEEFKEFEILDERFAQLKPETIRLLLTYARKHIEEFVKTD